LPALSLDLPIEELRGRGEALSQFAKQLHDASAEKELLQKVVIRIGSGKVGRAHEANYVYRTSGAAAISAWRGQLTDEIRSLDSKINSKTADLQGIVHPDRLA
jgi:hypothetical protein